MPEPIGSLPRSAMAFVGPRTRTVLIIVATALGGAGCGGAGGVSHAGATTHGATAPTTTATLRASTAPATESAQPLVSPTDVVPTSSCENPHDLVVETTTAATPLLGCPEKVRMPPPTISVRLHSRLLVTGLLSDVVRLSVPAGQKVVRLNGNQLTAVGDGTVVVTHSGPTPPCDYIETAQQRSRCPLFIVTVR
jgi:hypothetical protein